jgi:hypothetical protein
MTAMTTLPPLGLVALAVLVPLVREYAEFRRDWGLGRMAAAGTAMTLFPSLALGLALAMPLADRPVLQWTATVVATIALYSLATAALRPTLTEAPRRSA